MAKTPVELVDIDAFHMTYVDKYNARRKTLECLMDIYEKYYRDATPLETPQTEHVPRSTQTIQPIPSSLPRTGGPQ